MARIIRPVRVSTKGQMIIPVEVRRKLSIKPGDQLVIVSGDSEAIIMKPKRYAESPPWGGQGTLRQNTRGDRRLRAGRAWGVEVGPHLAIARPAQRAVAISPRAFRRKKRGRLFPSSPLRGEGGGEGGRTAVGAVETTTLPIRVDKSHLVTIGERLYAESIELVRELVNNAYDADATEVYVTIRDDEIDVTDNGLGMDLDGLREYFTIGTPDKRLNPRSPRFGRLRIGQFGIGKFATLSACERFTVRTQRGAFAAEVIFDKKEWERDGDRWDLPLRPLPSDPGRGDGTTGVLSRLRRRFDPVEVELHLMDSVPLRAPDFAVLLNGRRLIPLHLPGHRILVLEGTPYGPVHGEIVIVPAYLASTLEMGVEVKVRQVTVRRELFGMEAWGREAARVKGEVHADFLPVTADRSGFVRDSDEYRAFAQVMQGVIEEVRRALGRLSDRTDQRRARRAVKEAFVRIQRALARNPDLSPFGPVSLGAASAEGG